MSESLQERFRRERQLLAGLVHPNIARLYDGGETEQGQPYFVMEYIEGQSLPQWVAESAPSLTQRITIFVQICDAVAFAHQQLIVHRDLTPSNILVDSSGNARLIDFGIARPHEAPHDDAAMPTFAPSLDSLTLTPGYAAPERAQGRGATTLSDVFSLGRILTDLLSGHSDAELSAIAAKAAESDPDQRYSTVAALREDVSNWQRSLAVNAMPPSHRYRIGKFITRNKAQVALAATLAFAVMAGLFATGWQWREAAVARDEAQVRFADTRAVARFMLFDLYDKIEPIAGSTPALEQIARRSRLYLERLDDGRDLPPELRFEIAASYHRLANITGNPMGRNLGRREEARLFLDRSLQSLAALVRDNPDNAQYRKEYGAALYSDAVLRYISEEQTTESRQSAQLSAQQYDYLLRTKPKDKAIRMAWIDARLQAAKPLGDINENEKWIAEIGALLPPTEALARDFPDDVDVQLLLANIYSQWGSAMTWTYDPKGPDYPRAIAELDKAMAITDRLLANPDSRARSERQATLILWFRALGYSDLLRFDEALTDLERAEAIIEAQIRKDPDDAELVRRLESMWSQKIFVLFDMGRRADGIALAKKTAESRRARFEKEPGNPGFLRDYISSTAAYQELLFNDEQSALACPAMDQMMAQLDTLEKRKIMTPKDRMLYVDKMQEYAKTCSA